MKKVKKFFRNMLLYLPKSLAHKILYHRYFKKKLDLKNPKTFNEKLQYLIVYEYGEKQTKITDKVLLRDYVKELNLSEYMPKLYGVYKKSSEIDFNNLPEKFVLKTNHGSGSVFVCRNKKKFDFEKACTELDKQLKYNFAKVSLEYHYSKIKPQILCEELLDDGTGNLPIDYKIYCFDGKPDCILICSNRENSLKLDYYDTNWKPKDYSIEKYKSHNAFKKPDNLNEMLEIAKILSKEFRFVRVDLYSIKGKIYIGELTFTPAAGLIRYNTEGAQLRWGKMLNINEQKNQN